MRHCGRLLLLRLLRRLWLLRLLLLLLRRLWLLRRLAKRILVEWKYPVLEDDV